jgi:hypothetical protein
MGPPFRILNEIIEPEAFRSKRNANSDPALLLGFFAWPGPLPGKNSDPGVTADHPPEVPGNPRTDSTVFTLVAIFGTLTWLRRHP